MVKYIDFNNHIFNLKESLEVFEDIFRNKNFYIQCSDGKILNFMIKDNNLPHLLGINTFYIKKYFPFINNSFDFMLNIINNKKEWNSKLADKRINWNMIFNKLTDQKVGAFNKISSFNTSSIKFIVKYNNYKNISPNISNLDCDYMIYLGNDNYQNEGQFLFIEYGNDTKYFPKSLRSISSKKELISYIINQDIIIPVSIEIKNKNKNNISLFSNKEEQDDIKKFLSEECLSNVIDNRVNLSYFGGEDKIMVLSNDVKDLLMLQKRIIEERENNISDLQYEIYEETLKNKRKERNILQRIFKM